MKGILLVDDSEAVRQQLRLVLQQYDYRILEAADGFQALDLIEKQNISLVICDVNMPRMDGLELLERLKLHRRALPVLMLTVEANVTLIARARRSGVRGWIVKPFNAELLVKAVNSLLTR